MVGNSKRNTILTCGVVLALSCLASGFFALISAGAVGGTAMGVLPEYTFKWVEPIVCPAGTSLEYSSIRRSYHQPGESQPIVVCISEDGSRQDVLVNSILVVLAIVFVAIWVGAFLVISIPIGILAVLLMRWIQRRRSIGNAPGV